ncbi:SDR family oxidoreductase [Vannielia litorea]|uniref:NAD(P)-dependent dehydrogenase, short-chain alcohol dehydrogenase family n=1 Tax=Vannielia litorea TaxID=1217970 RepID=A0A1N6FT26_9RHOB|nr:SDR family oxidoreductase [Vannielia litorea]SIN98414.1 NAD(P)-dependent dehydrogenase, short-chain alcohol dehydrogenase family [Vannielia litorea]
MSTAPLLVFGAGHIGRAMAQSALAAPGAPPVHVVTRQPDAPDGATHHRIDAADEPALAALAKTLPEISGLLITTGTLHTEAYAPEKTLKALDPQAMAEVYRVNCILPATILKHFLPRLPRNTPAFAAALSARVGSISDNALGGWVSYRASKAALNQVIRTFSIELARTHPQARLIGLHPGTVATPLSQPYRGTAPTVFTPAESAAHLWRVIEGTTPEHSGNLFAWDGQHIAP